MKMATEKRLVWGDIAEEHLMKLAEYYKGSFSGDAFERAANEIRELPSVDAVEVVRCEDCRRWKRTGDCRHGICCLDGMELFKWNYEFCNRGERKDND